MVLLNCDAPPGTAAGRPGRAEALHVDVLAADNFGGAGHHQCDKVADHANANVTLDNCCT